MVPPSPEKRGASRVLQQKAREIQELLDQPEVDLWKLRGLAITEGGLLSDSIRKRAWPKLAGIHQRFWEEPEAPACFQPKSSEASDTTPKRSNINSSRSRTTATTVVRPPHPPTDVPKRLKNHRRDDSNTSISSSCSLRDRILASSLDARQIELDVTRCTWHLLTGTQRTQRIQGRNNNKKMMRLIRRKQRRLSNLINLTLVQSYRNNSKEKDNTLRYYQGYHDVACILLSTLSGNAPVPLSHLAPSSSLEAVAIASGLDLPAAVLLQISQAHLRDSMRANFTHLQTSLRLVMFPLLAYFDPDVHEHLAMCEMEPFFALSWVITWFAHEIRDTELTKRLFDFFLVSHPLMPLYVSIAMVAHPLNRQDVLQTECDFALVHQTLAALPRNSSMVGWKYQPGDGYVSDDEEDLDDDDDDDASSFGMSSQGSVDTEFLLQEEAKRAQLAAGEWGAEAVSIVSSSMSTFSDARVPFQELIDTALSFMQRMPPRNLTQLATRYYGSAFVNDALKKAPELFRDPPAWTLAATAKSDRSLKLNATKLQSEAGQEYNEESPLLSSSNTGQLLGFPDRIKNCAAIAAGVAPGDDTERRRNRKKRLFVAGAVAVALVAVAVGVVLTRKRGTRRNVGTSSSDTQPQILMATSSSRNVMEESVKKTVLIGTEESTFRSMDEMPSPEPTPFTFTPEPDLDVADVEKLPAVDQLVSGLVTFMMQEVLLTKLLKPLKDLQRVSRQLRQKWREVIRLRLFNRKGGLLELPSSQSEKSQESHSGQCNWSERAFFDKVATSNSLNACWNHARRPRPNSNSIHSSYYQDDSSLTNHPIVRGFSDLAGHLQRLPLDKLINFVDQRKQDLHKISLTTVQSAISDASVSTQYERAIPVED